MKRKKEKEQKYSILFVQFFFFTVENYICNKCIFNGNHKLENVFQFFFHEDYKVFNILCYFF